MASREAGRSNQYVPACLFVPLLSCVPSIPLPAAVTTLAPWDVGKCIILEVGEENKGEKAVRVAWLVGRRRHLSEGMVEGWGCELELERG